MWAGLLLVRYGVGVVRRCCPAGWCRGVGSGYTSLTAIPRWCAGLRGGALTGRRPLGLASLVARLFFVRCGIGPCGWCYTARFSMGRGQPRLSGAASATARRPVRAPPRRPAHQRGIAVSEINQISKPRPDYAATHQPHSPIPLGT